MKLDVLIIAAHPDDAELSMGGTIAKLTSRGFKVGIIDLTQGELGTRGNKFLRKKEADEASKFLNVTLRENLQLKDGSLYDNDTNRKLLIEKIRKYKPTLLFAPYFNDRHPDHIAASKLTKSAIFFAGVTKIKTKADEENQEVFRPQKLFYYMQAYSFEPTFIIDISEYFEIKMKSVFAFKTQFYNPDINEPKTFISDPKFVKYLEARARFYGFQIGKDYGEAFYCEELIEYDFFNLLGNEK